MGAGDFRARPDLAAQERVYAAQQVDAPVVVQMSELVRGEQFAAGALVVDGVAAARAFRFARGAGVDGLLAEDLRDPFRGGWFVAAEEQCRIAVAGDRLPAFLVHRLDLRDGLEDHAHRNASRTDCGDQLVEIRDSADVRELVQETVQGSGELLPGVGSATLDDAVEQALIEDRGDEVERRILVRQGEEYGFAPLRTRERAVGFVLVCSDVVDADGVGAQNLAYRSHLDGSEPYAQRDDDAFLRLSRALRERTVLRRREPHVVGPGPVADGVGLATACWTIL